MGDFEECSRCGKKLKRGETKYVIYISIVSDFDGVIPAPEGDAISSILEKVADIPEEELDQEVYEEMAFLVCKSCRDKFREDPLSVSNDVEAMRGRTGHSFN